MAGGSRKSADEALAAALASGKTVREAALAAGVSESTTYKRLREDPAFKDRVRELRAAMVAATMGRMVDGTTAAADALNELVKDPSPNIRFRAAVAIIELALKLREQTDLEERLAEVERQLAGGGSDGNPDAGGES